MAVIDESSEDLTRRIDDPIRDLLPAPAVRYERIGAYPVRGELGHGGMGVVYLAEDPNLKRRVAIKVLPSRVAGEPDSLARFQSEAQLLAAMNHPNVATVYSLENQDDLHFITMELVQGRSLSELLETGPLSLAQSLSICRQIAIALEAAHKQGVIHCDLKPRNIMVTPEGNVKVLDFGLARSMLWSRGGSRMEHILGTPGYMSPEQIRGDDLDHRTDIWSFGCILYACLVGRGVSSGDTPTDKTAARLERKPNWEALPQETPNRIRSLLKRCLEKDLDKRLGQIALARREIEEEVVRRTLPGEALGVGSPAGANPNNLPVQIASFVGREQQIEDARRLLDENRLLTLTGAGGCGKTRLALEVSNLVLGDFPDGVWFVELAPLEFPELVPQTVAAEMGVTEERNRPVIDSLLDYLRGKTLLLVLDNCEHLLGATSDLVNALLRARSDLRILVTSREAMGLTGEVIHRVPALAIPSPEEYLHLEELSQVEAVRLFVERARAVDLGFRLTRENAPSVVHICRQLDGIPLAIELAAARAKMLPLDEIGRRLDDRFRLLTGGSKTSLLHHQTLRALIDWSYEHLPDSEQALLRRLSVFAGGWTLEAAEIVCSDDGIETWEVLDLLSHLVDKSLVEVDVESAQDTGRARYHMLETVRQYSRDDLVQKGECEDVCRRHRDYYVAVAEEAEPHIRSSGQTYWFELLEEENDNIRVALRSLVGTESDGERELRIAGALGRFWMIRGHWSEGQAHYDDLLALPAAKRQTTAVADSLNGAGNLAFHLSKYDRARDFHSRALEIRRELGDLAGVAKSVNNLGEVARHQGNYSQAGKLYDECTKIQIELGDRWGLAVSLNNLGETFQSLGDYEKARSYHEQALAIWPEFEDKWGVAFSLNNLGFVAETEGKLEEAVSFYEKSLALRREIGDSFGIAASLSALGFANERLGSRSEAQKHYSEALVIRKKLGDRAGIADSLERIAMLLFDQGERGRVVRLLGAAAVLREEIQAPHSPSRREELAQKTTMLKNEIGKDSYDKERSSGRAMPMDQVIQEALDAEEKKPKSP
jgi:non-specific serine/threonine protein kinase